LVGLCRPVSISTASPLRAARVSSTALVRYRCNDYSVPTAFGYQDVLVKGFVEDVVILCRGQAGRRRGRLKAFLKAS